MAERQSELRDAFIEARGYWSDDWEGLLGLDPDFFEAYLNLSLVPWRTGVLEPKVKEFISIAVDGASTHLFASGLKAHISRAVEHGATRDEIMEVLQLTSTMGIHAAVIGVPLLIEALQEAGRWSGGQPLNERQEQLKADFTANRGYWHEFWNGLLELDTDFFEAYTDFSSLPWKRHVLEPKVKEFIYIAFDVSATHLFVPGLKLHLRNALAHGATAAELMEVIEIASEIGIHACNVAVPMVLEAFGGTAPASG